MNSGPLRVHLAPGYALHQRAFRDTSLIVELFTRDHGRLSTFARGARGQRGVRRGGTGRFAGLQSFQRLLLSWHGRGEAPLLTGAESDGPLVPLPPEQWISGCYMNELLLKLTAQHDPQPALFALYERTLLELAAARSAEPVLRAFEKQLLEVLGFGVEFGFDAGSGEPVVDEARYRFDAGSGLYRADSSAPVTFSGRMLLALAVGEPLQGADALHEARTLMRLAIDHCLEGRPLRTRAVARSIARLERTATRGPEARHG